jgi:DNA polymerase-3 subunit alpha
MYLNAHSCYSLRYGLVKPEELLQLAVDRGYKRMVLTDINNTSGCLNFIRLAPQYGVQPVVGIDFRHGIKQLYVAIAQDNLGFEEMNTFLSGYLNQEEIPLPVEPPEWQHCYVIYPLDNIPQRALKSYEYVGVRSDQLNKIKLGHTISMDCMVMLESATFRSRSDYSLHKLLRAIDLNTIYTKVTPEDYASERDFFLDRDELIGRYLDHVQLIQNTQKILDGCSISFDFDSSSPKNQKTFTGSVAKDVKLMRRLCRDNLRYRYPTPTDEILKRIEKELSIIIEKDFVSYFLINWDITSYARSRGYFYVGRGSGANSIVAYLLRITDVDPIELDLYFERFINLYRENPPDFDIDFSWKDRNDVTQYIFDRFPHTALLATYNTFQFRAAVRELGKVFGLPKEELDLIIRGKPVFKQLDSLSQLVIKYASLLQGLPSHLSVHAAGIIISERPIQHYTATFVPPKGFPTTQFDMVIAEDVGLYKFDILGQRGLAKIKDGLRLVRENNPTHDQIDIHDLKRFKQDDGVKALLREGKAIGCFYVESPAMRMLLKKLKVDHYLGLVAASSIIRPGVAQSGMMREYILRERNPEKRKEAHPVLWDIMPDTYGIMVYQEDVIKVAHYFAGLTLGEADVLRRGMSGKYRSRAEFDRVRDKFFSNCRAKGYADSLSTEVWRQIESFAGYAFAKGHSASYAVESYQSLYLKAHYPLEYMVATINNGGGFYRPELYIHEARMLGGNIHAPCVNRSDYICHIEDKDIYIGMGFVHGIESDFVKQMVSTRQSSGPYEDLVDFVERTGIGLEQLSALIRVNAFRFTGKQKKELLWKAHQLLNKSKNTEQQQTKLFKRQPKEYQLPSLELEDHEEAFDQIELLGFPLCSPFDLIDSGEPISDIRASDMAKYCNQTISITGYLITVKDTGTKNGKRMNFGTFIDRSGYFIDTTHFPNVARDYPFRGRGVYHITGKVVEEFGFYSIEVSQMSKLSYITDPRFNEKSYQINGRSFSSRRRKTLKAN